MHDLGNNWHLEHAGLHDDSARHANHCCQFWSMCFGRCGGELNAITALFDVTGTWSPLPRHWSTGHGLMIVRRQSFQTPQLRHVGCCLRASRQSSATSGVICEPWARRIGKKAACRCQPYITIFWSSASLAARLLGSVERDVSFINFHGTTSVKIRGFSYPLPNLCGAWVVAPNPHPQMRG